MAINSFLASLAGFFGESRGGARRRRVGCGYGIDPGFSIWPSSEVPYTGPDDIPPGEILSYGPSPLAPEFTGETTSIFPLVLKQWALQHWGGGSLWLGDTVTEGDPPGPLVFNDDWGCTRKMLLTVQDTKLAVRPPSGFWTCAQEKLFHIEAELTPEALSSTLPQLHFSAPGWPHTDPFGPLLGQIPSSGPHLYEWAAGSGFAGMTLTPGTWPCSNEPNYWLLGFFHSAFGTTIVWRGGNRLDPRGTYDRIGFIPGSPPEDPSNTLTVTIS